MPESERRAEQQPHRRAQDRNFVTRFMAAHGAWVAVVAAVLSGSGIGAAFASRWAFLNEAPAAIAELHDEMQSLRQLLEQGGTVAIRVQALEERVQALEGYVVVNRSRNTEQDRILQELLDYQTETLCMLRALSGESGYPQDECLRRTTAQRLEALREQLKNSSAQLQSRSP